MTGGLPTTLTLAYGARVMLIKNLDVQDGLVNSAIGTVTGFIPQLAPESDTESFVPKYILVRFDDERVGKNARSVSRGLLSDSRSTPISTSERPVRFGRLSKVSAKRTQFPLVLAWGVTIHKEQGKTEDELVLSMKGTFHAGQFYTAISRTREMEGLHIIGEVKLNHIKVNKAALKEINRMRKEACFTPWVPWPLECDTDIYLRLLSFNVNSLHAHAKYLQKDNHVASSHVMCLSETWLQQTDVVPDVPMHNSLRNDSATLNENRSGGLLMHIHHDFVIVRATVLPDISTEHQLVILSPRLEKSKRLCILSIYNHPITKMSVFLSQLELLVSAIPQGIPAMVCGDFNVDHQKTSPSSSKLIKLMSYYGFLQCVLKPTHRSGGLLDHLYINFSLEGSVIDVVPTYYSDHLLVAAAIPLIQIFHWKIILIGRL